MISHSGLELKAAILFTCFRLKYAVFRKKINPFEAVNRKLKVLDSLNGGNWTFHGKEIRF